MARNISIALLPITLINQIAAGEIVERPASVIKELLENSLDAGASVIDITLEAGGLKLIRVRDNGCGIPKSQLSLALARHATNKIQTINDLSNIKSLGFRGEALASISSISRFSLTSRYLEQAEGWQVSTNLADNNDISDIIKPAAHPVGTTIEVLDLFYNVPARRKFVRSEKTEFLHINEVIKQIALSHFSINITLYHNGKLIRQYPIAADNNTNAIVRRLQRICGSRFSAISVPLDYQYNGMQLHGWINNPNIKPNNTAINYFYVNKRIVYDRLIRHAIQQAYCDVFRDKIFSSLSYVLFFSIDPQQVDVNVHPTKKEVRFYQARAVHDFIYQTIVTALVLYTETADINDKELDYANNKKTSVNPAAVNKTGIAGEVSLSSKQTNNKTAGKKSDISKINELNKFEQSVNILKNIALYEHQPAYNNVLFSQSNSTIIHEPNEKTVSIPINHAEQKNNLYATQYPQKELYEGGQDDQSNTVAMPFGKVLKIYPPTTALIEYGDDIALLALHKLEYWYFQQQLSAESSQPISQALLIPMRIKIMPMEHAIYQKNHHYFTQLGFEISIENDYILLHSVPQLLNQQSLAELMSNLLNYLVSEVPSSKKNIINWLINVVITHDKVWSIPQAIQLLTEIEQSNINLLICMPTFPIYKLNIDIALSQFKNE